MLLHIALLILQFFILRGRHRRKPQLGSAPQKPNRVDTRNSPVSHDSTVSLAEVRHHHQVFSAELRRAWSDHNEKDRLAKSLNFRQMGLDALLAHANRDELVNLQAILKCDATFDGKVLAQALLNRGSSRIVSLIRKTPVSYDTVLTDIAKKLGVEVLASSDYSGTEARLVQEVNKRMIQGMSDAQRTAYLHEVAKNNGRNDKSVLIAGGGLILANLSGFGLYTAASASLGAVTGAVGITLPFAAYTGLSSALAAITGPAGWTALGLVALYQIGKTDLKKTLPAVLCVAAIRARLSSIQEGMLRELSRTRPLLETQQQRIKLLEKFLTGMANRDSKFRVPRSSVPF